MPVAPSTTGFSILLCFRDSVDGDRIAFKVDGERFKTNSRTLKFAADSRYKISVETKPPVEFHHLHVGGSDLALNPDDHNGKPGKYVADWNTTGISATKRGDREDVLVNLQGPGGLLRHKLQCKFYKKEDSHATWGHKMEGIEWNCVVDTTGSIAVTEEAIK